MTISANDRRKEYAGNGVTTVFTGPRAFSASHIAVYERDDATLAATLRTDYTLTNVGVRNRQTVVTMLAAPALGKTLLVLRTVPYQQDTDITNQGQFNPQVFEDALDAIEQQVQQISEGQERSLRVADTATGVQPIGNTPNRYVVTGADGNPTLADSPPAADLTLRGDMASASAGKGAALVGWQQSGTAAVPTSLDRKARDTVSVRDFMTAGEVADTQLAAPLLDHTAAIQRAINAQSISLVKDATRLHFPFGHYRISSELVVLFNGVLFGDGVECTTLTLLNATQNGIRVPYSGTLQIHGIHIKAGVAKTAGAGIKVEGISAASASSQTRIFNIKVDGQYVGIDMANAGFWSIRDTVISDAYIGIRVDNTQNFDGGDSIIGEGVLIYRTGSDSTSGTRAIQHVGAGGLKLVGVKILGFDHGYSLIPRIGATYIVDTQIIGCSMEFQNNSIHMDTQNAGTSIAQFTIVGNQLAPRANGVYLRGNVGGGAVLGNQIGVQFASASAVRLASDGVNTPGNVNVSGNQVSGNSSASSIGIHGGFAPAVNNNAIHGNLISGVASKVVGFLGKQTDVTYTFANLPSDAVAGSIIYCSDGTTANPVAGGGTGCIAKRLNGAWVGN